MSDFTVRYKLMSGAGLILVSFSFWVTRSHYFCDFFSDGGTSPPNFFILLNELIFGARYNKELGYFKESPLRVISMWLIFPDEHRGKKET
jgi:hypothetical protein